ncbi:MAG TPA: very short patch repair endonuclease [Terriglobia bacterium]|nr:very short patch repair endonuclease [Terriglobia bacterium]
MESREVRRRTMQAVKSKNTAPELAVRSLAHRMGYRFRLHRKDLPGKPDLVFPRRRKVVFVHGCFWHGHNCPRGARAPKANAAYWRTKIRRNHLRHAAHLVELKRRGWRATVIWECELKNPGRVCKRLARFLG